SSRQLLPEFRSDIELVVTRQIQRNGAFGADAILRYFDTPWILAASRTMENPTDFLSPLLDAAWTTADAREAYYERILEGQRAMLNTSIGETREFAVNNFINWQTRWVDYLLEQKQAARAQASLAALPEEFRERLSSQLPSFDLRIAAQTGRL